MSEEKFFQQVKSSLYDFAPEVPAGVYGGMRRKLWMSNFLTWNWSSLNVWYVTLMLAAGVALISGNTGSSELASKAVQTPIESTQLMISVATTPVAPLQQEAVAVAKAPQKKTTVLPIAMCSVEQNANKELPDCDLPTLPEVEPEVIPTAEMPQTEEPLSPIAKEDKKTRTLQVDVFVGENK